LDFRRTESQLNHEHNPKKEIKRIMFMVKLWLCVILGFLEKWIWIMILDVYLMIWSSENVYYKCCDHRQCFELIWVCCNWVKQFKSDYMVKNTFLKLILTLHVSSKSAPNCQNWAVLLDHLEKFNFFTIFLFELGFGVNMKVVDMDVRFLVALVWLHYNF